MVILELIHARKPRPYGKGAFIRTRPIGFGHPLVNLNNPAEHTSLSRCHILQVSALSTVDGRLHAYRGCNG